MHLNSLPHQQNLWRNVSMSHNVYQMKVYGCDEATVCVSLYCGLLMTSSFYSCCHGNRIDFQILETSWNVNSFTFSAVLSQLGSNFRNNCIFFFFYEKTVNNWAGDVWSEGLVARQQTHYSPIWSLSEVPLWSVNHLEMIHSSQTQVTGVSVW